MLLKRLEAYGFKSFADRIEIEFDRGITAVVGPNGSGKSNITDAIRWVLGEQNIRNLRGSKAEDIIFAGSSARKPAGIAQVSLTFDNEDGKLPLEFQEITISRRLFRTGESEFYINKARCRLKDIYGLFADTGIGRDSISVISQNKVDEVLNAKPEDRRLLFEECAGITKYRDRKREAVRKLESTQQNALRINDIILEIEKQLAPLSSEAERTAQYNELKAQYDNYRLSYILCSYENFSAKEKEYSQQIEQLQQQKVAIDTELKAFDAENASLEEGTAVLEKTLTDAQQHNRKLAEEIDRNRNKCTVLEERIKQNSHSITTMKAAIDLVCSQKKTAEEKLAALRTYLEDADKKKAVHQAELLAAQTAVKDIEKEVTDKETALQQYRLQLEEKRRIREEQQHQLIMLQHDLTEKKNVLGEKENLLAKIENDSKAINRQLELLNKELAAANTSKKDIGQIIASLQDERTDTENKCRLAETECNGLAQGIDRTKERIKILTNMQKAYEGFGNGVKSVLTSREQLWYGGICGSVAELISVQQQYITAIQVALGGSMQNIITEDTETAKKAIIFLKRNKLGRVTFLPISVIKPHKIMQEDLTGFPGFINYADKLVETDNKYRKIIENLLGRTIVVDNIDNALILAKRKNFSVRIITLGGEIIHAGGAMSGGSIRREISFLNRNEEIKLLIGNNETAVNKLLLAKTKLSQLMANSSALEKKIKIEQEKMQQCVLLCTEKEIKATHLRTDQERVNSAVAETIAAISTIKSAISGLEERCQKQNYNNKEKSADNIEPAAEQLVQELSLCKTKRTDLQEKLLQQTSSFASFQQTLKGNVEKMDLIAAECSRYEESLQNNHTEQLRLQTVIDESVQELQELQISNKNLQQLHASGRQEYDKIYAELMDKRVKNKELVNKRKQTVEKMSLLQENIHQADIKITKISFELEQCEKKLQEEYNLSPQEALTHKVDVESAILSKEIKRLQTEIAAIGTVNPNAIKEYDSLHERYQFMKTQLEDLLTAKNNLQQIIEQMDITMTKQFKEAFNQIGQYFNTIFEKLFGGGKAQLLLTTPEDVLSSGVEIIVQTPGKKNQNLALLSGGERTLTVIALLFSFLQYRPAPFSVLDEIDAPLDEANIKRFGVFLKDYAVNTQFIIVTHRKGTMEAADVMYGVTIENAGISKIVSVRMEERDNK